MKLAIIFCAFIIQGCLSLPSGKSDNCNLVKGDLSLHYGTCGRITCHKDGSTSAVGCGTYNCAEGKQIGYKKSDNTKPFPDCCGNPICAD